MVVLKIGKPCSAHRPRDQVPDKNLVWAAVSRRASNEKRRGGLDPFRSYGTQLTQHQLAIPRGRPIELEGQLARTAVENEQQARRGKEPRQRWKGHVRIASPEASKAAKHERHDLVHMLRRHQMLVFVALQAVG
jgi:hypothetical protein